MNCEKLNANFEKAKTPAAKWGFALSFGYGSIQPLSLTRSILLK